MSEHAGMRSVELWKLVEQRTVSGSDTTAIDERIWSQFGEQWTIMFTDLAGFSRQVAKFGIIHFLQVIFEQKRLLLPLVEQHDGTLVKVEADSLLIGFENTALAVRCAVAMQHACRSFNTGRDPEEQLVLCVGLGHGRVLKIGDEDVFGHEVNLASKLGEDAAKPTEILATAACRAAAGDVAGVVWEEIQADFAGGQVCWRAAY